MTNIEETEDINLNDVENEDESTNEEDVDELKAELAKERAEREKFEARFKRTAKQLNEFKSEELFEKKFNEKMFFMNNPTAKEFEKEIKDVQDSSNLGIEDAYTLFLARKQSLEANKTSP